LCHFTLDAYEPYLVKASGEQIRRGEVIQHAIILNLVRGFMRLLYWARLIPSLNNKLRLVTVRVNPHWYCLISTFTRCVHFRREEVC